MVLDRFTLSPMGVLSDMNKIFDVDVKSGETVLLEPSYLLC